MAAENTGTVLELTKKVYGDDLSQGLKFENGIIGELLPMKPGATLGDTYKFAVPLQTEHSFLYNGTDGAVATLPDAVAGLIKQAEVSAYEVIGKARIASRIMHDATSSGPAAFRSATEAVLQALMYASEFREEHSNLYGQEGICKVTGNTSGVLSIDTATFSPATLDGLEGAILEAWTSQGASATQHNGDLTVSAVDLTSTAPTITVTGTNSAVVNNDWLYFKGARTASAYKEMPGVHKLLTTITGTVNGLATQTYSRWRPNVKTSFGNPILGEFLKAISLITGRRVRKKEMNLLLPVDAFDRLADNLSALRRFDGSYRKGAVAGFETIEFFSSLGLTKIIPHAFLRNGDALAFSNSNGFFTGSTPLQWEKGPGGSADIWKSIDANNSYECRTTYIKAPAFLRPYETLGISGLTYT